MSIRLQDLLTLTGRLDDAPGFDSARERLRRFLIDSVTDPQVAASLLDDCQHAIGEQPHRVLQDIVVLLGRFLGFEPSFGTYQRVAGAVKFDGQWRSRRLHVVLEVRSDQIRATDLDSLERSLAAVAAASHIEPDECLGLCVVARQYAGRVRLESLVEEEHRADIRVVSVHTLAWLAAAVHGGRLRHDEVLKLLKSRIGLDFAVDLLQRMTSTAEPPIETSAASVASPAVPEPETSAPESREAFWVTTITGNDKAAPEQLLSSVIGQRRILGVTSEPQGQENGEPGDWVCLLVPDRGVVGHAQLSSIIENGAGVVRQSEQFSRLFRLENVELYEEPVRVLNNGIHQFFIPAGGSSTAPRLTRVSREDFIAMTMWDEFLDAGSDPAAARDAANRY